MVASPYSQDLIVKWAGGIDDMPVTTTRYVAMFVGDPEAGGVEVTSVSPGLSIPRPDLTAALAAEDVGGELSTEALLSFGVGVGNRSGMTHVAVFDASTGGNRICSDPVTFGPLAAVDGVAFQVPIASFRLKVT
jgi:hypothetical protein